MRRHLRKYLPDHEAIRANRWLRPFENTLLHPRLWDLNRHSAAGAVAGNAETADTLRNLAHTLTSAISRFRT